MSKILISPTSLDNSILPDITYFEEGHAKFTLSTLSLHPGELFLREVKSQGGTNCSLQLPERTL